MHRGSTALSPVSRCLRDLWGEVFTQELRITNERLIAENSSLVEQVTELRRINNILETDLAASRQAFVEEIANLCVADMGTSVTALASQR